MIAPELQSDDKQVQSMKPRIAIASIMKNEAPYLLEWLAWHRLMGVETFVIGDNESSDGLTEMLISLEEHEVLTRFSVSPPPGRAPQIEAYEIVATQHADAADWIFVIDADEFVVPTNADALRAYVDRIPEDVGAVCVNWAVFGSSERVAPGAGVVMRRFVNRAHSDAPVNRHYKSLVRGEALGAGSKNVHHINIKPGWRRVDTDFADIELDRGVEGLSAAVCWSGVRLNHYVIKSWSEFWNKKVSRGRATGMPDQRGETFFNKHDINDAYDPLPIELHARLLDEIATLRDMIPDVLATVREGDIAASTTKQKTYRADPRGNIDSAAINADGELVVYGWALTPEGGPVGNLNIRAGDQILPAKSVKIVERSDVARTYQGASESCGFEIRIDPSLMPSSGGQPCYLQIFGAPADISFGKPRRFS
jgi:Glycosyl transferase family 2